MYVQLFDILLLFLTSQPIKEQTSTIFRLKAILTPRLQAFFTFISAI